MAKLMRKRILKIAIPSGLTFLLDVINLTVAIFFIGKFGPSAIAALGIGINYVVVCYIAVSSIFFVGTNAQVSRFFGAKNYTSMNECFSSLFYGSILVSIPLLIFSYLGINGYISWMGALPLTSKLSKEFLEITIFLVPIFLVKNVMVSSFTAVSNAKIPFYVKIFNTFLNLGLGYTLIHGIEGFNIGLGIVGAAYTNLIVASLEIFLLFFAVLSKRHLLLLLPKIKYIYLKIGLKLGFPSGVERVFTFLALLLITKFLVKFGDDILAGAQIGERIESFCYMPGFGFMITSMSLVGQCIGANNIKRARLYVRQILQISSIIMGTLGFSMMFFAEELASFFTKDPEAIYSAKLYLYIIGISQIPLVWVFVLDGVIRGAGKTMYSLVINSFSIWVLRLLPMWLLLIYDFDYKAIYSCVAMETLLRACILYYVYRSNIWAKNLKLS